MIKGRGVESNTGDALDVRVETTLAGIAPQAWDALTGAENPFIEYAFLSALEDSGATGPDTGWLPNYLVVYDAAQQLVGAAPLYAKGDSYGEYIFDWGWANAAHRGGLQYYPKLTVAVPFTPASGPRMLVHPDADQAEIRRTLAFAAVELARRVGASGIHWLFCQPDEAAELAELGYSPRLTRQFHWHSGGWETFEAFLGSLTSKRRKEVRRERRRAHGHGLEIRVLRGAEMSDVQWRAIYRFYARTVRMNGQIQYLPERFFELVRERLPERVLCVLCERDGAPIAGNISFTKGAALFGRYWGCDEELDALHFECCYYQLIDYAITHGLTRFEAGAQGHHKLARGLSPSFIHSAHLIVHPGLREAIDRFLVQEAEQTRMEKQWLTERGPYRRDEGDA